MFYTYLIRSLKFPSERYIGHTSDLKQRIVEHNSGKCEHTAKFVPGTFAFMSPSPTSIQQDALSDTSRAGQVVLLRTVISGL